MIKSAIPTESKQGLKACHGRREIQEHPRLDRADNRRSKETGRKARENVLTDRKKEAADSAKGSEGYRSIQREKCPRLSSRHMEKIDAIQRTERDGNHVESTRDGAKRSKLPTREKVEQHPSKITEKGSVKSQVYSKGVGGVKICYSHSMNGFMFYRYIDLWMFLENQKSVYEVARGAAESNSSFFSAHQASEVYP